MNKQILCIGAMLWDVIGRSPRPMAGGADVPGRISHIPGGVALNVALAMARQGLMPAILSSVGTDAEGDSLIAAASAQGVDCGFLARDAARPTDIYMAIEDPTGLIAAIADAHGLEDAGEAILAPLRDGRLASAQTPWRGIVVLDGNLTPEILAITAKDPALSQADLRVVPASPGKADRLRPLLATPRAMFYVNLVEAEVLAGRSFENARQAAEGLIAAGALRAIVTDGARLAAEAILGAETITDLPPPVTITRVTGAGDTLLAAHLAAGLAGATRAQALHRAVTAAAAHVAGQDISAFDGF